MAIKLLQAPASSRIIPPTREKRFNCWSRAPSSGRAPSLRAPTGASIEPKGGCIFAAPDALMQAPERRCGGCFAFAAAVESAGGGIAPAALRRTPQEKGEAPLSACQRRLRASRLTTAHLLGASDESLVMHAAALAARAAADPCLIDLDVLIDATADAIPIRADHSGAKLVKKQY